MSFASGATLGARGASPSMSMSPAPHSPSPGPGSRTGGVVVTAELRGTSHPDCLMHRKWQLGVDAPSKLQPLSLAVKCEGIEFELETEPMALGSRIVYKDGAIDATAIRHRLRQPRGLIKVHFVFRGALLPPDSAQDDASSQPVEVVATSREYFLFTNTRQVSAFRARHGSDSVLARDMPTPSPFGVPFRYLKDVSPDSDAPAAGPGSSGGGRERAKEPRRRKRSWHSRSSSASDTPPYTTFAFMVGVGGASAAFELWTSASGVPTSLGELKRALAMRFTDSRGLALTSVSVWEPVFDAWEPLTSLQQLVSLAEPTKLRGKLLLTTDASSAPSAPSGRGTGPASSASPQDPLPPPMLSSGGSSSVFDVRSADDGLPFLSLDELDSILHMSATTPAGAHPNPHSSTAPAPQAVADFDALTCATDMDLTFPELELQPEQPSQPALFSSNSALATSLSPQELASLTSRLVDELEVSVGASAPAHQPVYDLVEVLPWQAVYSASTSELVDWTGGQKAFSLTVMSSAQSGTVLPSAATLNIGAIQLDVSRELMATGASFRVVTILSHEVVLSQVAPLVEPAMARAELDPTTPVVLAQLPVSLTLDGVTSNARAFVVYLSVLAGSGDSPAPGKKRKLRHDDDGAGIGRPGQRAKTLGAGRASSSGGASSSTAAAPGLGWGMTIWATGPRPSSDLVVDGLSDSPVLSAHAAALLPLLLQPPLAMAQELGSFAPGSLPAHVAGELVMHAVRCARVGALRVLLFGVHGHPSALASLVPGGLRALDWIEPHTGHTVVHLAVLLGSPFVLGSLLIKYAPIMLRELNTPNSAGLTPLGLALSLGRRWLVPLLLHFGAVPQLGDCAVPGPLALRAYVALALRAATLGRAFRHGAITLFLRDWAASHGQSSRATLQDVRLERRALTPVLANSDSQGSWNTPGSPSVSLSSLSSSSSSSSSWTATASSELAVSGDAEARARSSAPRASRSLRSGQTSTTTGRTVSGGDEEEEATELAAEPALKLASHEIELAQFGGEPYFDPLDPRQRHEIVASGTGGGVVAGAGVLRLGVVAGGVSRNGSPRQTEPQRHSPLAKRPSERSEANAAPVWSVWVLSALALAVFVMVASLAVLIGVVTVYAADTRSCGSLAELAGQYSSLARRGGHALGTIRDRDYFNCTILNLAGLPLTSASGGAGNASDIGISLCRGIAASIFYQGLDIDRTLDRRIRYTSFVNSADVVVGWDVSLPRASGGRVVSGPLVHETLAMMTLANGTRGAWLGPDMGWIVPTEAPGASPPRREELAQLVQARLRGEVGLAKANMLFNTSVCLTSETRERGGERLELALAGALVVEVASLADGFVALNGGQISGTGHVFEALPPEEPRCAAVIGPLSDLVAEAGATAARAAQSPKSILDATTHDSVVRSWAVDPQPLALLGSMVVALPQRHTSDAVLATVVSAGVSVVPLADQLGLSRVNAWDDLDPLSSEDYMLEHGDKLYDVAPFVHRVFLRTVLRWGGSLTDMVQSVFGSAGAELFLAPHSLNAVWSAGGALTAATPLSPNLSPASVFASQVVDENEYDEGLVVDSMAPKPRITRGFFGVVVSMMVVFFVGALGYTIWLVAMRWNAGHPAAARRARDLRYAAAAHRHKGKDEEDIVWDEAAGMPAGWAEAAGVDPAWRVEYMRKVMMLQADVDDDHLWERAEVEYGA
ncbi:uncharacterized protein AMSG_01363 [Thecamonas trahens ATCC 50062]|uniref:Uncharacterized protein n=1 Tax=Thecamonas trahens ATCC 50062 TaxID=461836 RepID=A0A0L0DMX4_THETB|nr:hypothetical protein AMSG_01363 [Thecamonas trahens ATCC 50062]KNC53654.1 hypothetical protein AMSG_01363 [Thecamonas trahens ATCC 50062]|eukprot:XP_013761969.1 hypothetical protein AMSG_01363 [Thecamonas trahens ATCC 50062]